MQIMAQKQPRHHPFSYRRYKLSLQEAQITTKYFDLVQILTFCFLKNKAETTKNCNNCQNLAQGLEFCTNLFGHEDQDFASTFCPGGRAFDYLSKFPWGQPGEGGCSCLELTDTYGTKLSCCFPGTHLRGGYWLKRNSSP